MSLEKVDATQIVTYAPDGVSDQRLLGQVGNISGLNYGYAWPGGANSLTASLLMAPGPIPAAIKLGRVVKAQRGAGTLWEGILQAPKASPSGWSLTAAGNGTYGDNYSAVWDTWDQNNAITKAISRGMRWIMPAGGLPSGLYLAQQQASGSQQISAFMAELVTYGAQGWKVDPYGNLSVYNVPVPPYTPDRIIIATVPAGRTIVGDINTTWLNYQVTADPTQTTTGSGTDTTTGTAAATDALTEATVPADIAEHGPYETYVDLSAATSIASAGAAQGIGNSLLSQFQRGSFTDAFTVQPGQLLTMGGVPVDLGTECDMHVYQVWISDGSFGGEIFAGPLCFPGGATTFDDDTQTLQITPLQAAISNFSTLVTAAVDANTPPPSTSS